MNKRHIVCFHNWQNDVELFSVAVKGETLKSKQYLFKFTLTMFCCKYQDIAKPRRVSQKSSGANGEHMQLKIRLSVIEQIVEVTILELPFDCYWYYTQYCQ